MAATMGASVLSSVTVYKITSTLDHRDQLREEAEEDKKFQENFQQQQQQQHLQQQKILAVILRFIPTFYFFLIKSFS